MFNPYSSIPILDDGDSTGWNIYIFRADDKSIQNIINRIVEHSCVKGSSSIIRFSSWDYTKTIV